MTIMAARIALLVVGLAVWGYGVRADDSQLRVIGIALLAVSLILRFFRRKTPPGAERPGG